MAAIPRRLAGSNTYADYLNLLWGLIQACEQAGQDRELAIALMQACSPSPVAAGHPLDQLLQLEAVVSPPRLRSTAGVGSPEPMPPAAGWPVWDRPCCPAAARERRSENRQPDAQVVDPAATAVSTDG